MAEQLPDPQLPDAESVRLAMQLAWKDHHHARDQTWKGVQIVAVLGAGLITVDIQLQSIPATSTAALLLVAAAVFGMLITINHRKLERRKFIHIMNCEEWLGLHRDDLIPLSPDSERAGGPASVRDGSVSVPQKFSFWNVLNPRKHNTSLFILRMHLAITLLALVFVIVRIF